MNRKLVSILLVLVMCLFLAVPAFAEPAEEPAAPEETVTLPVEAETPAPKVNETQVNEPAPEDVTAPEDAAEYFPAEGDPALSDFGAAGSIVLDDVSASDDVEEFLRRMILKTTGIEDWKRSDPAEIEAGAGSIAVVRSNGTVWIRGDNVYSGLDQTDRDALAPASIRPPVKDHNHTTVVVNTDTYQHDATQHQLIISRYEECDDPDCGFFCYTALPQLPEPHTWTQTNITYTNQGDNHKATHHYICNVCGATAYTTEEEAHSWTAGPNEAYHYLNTTTHTVDFTYTCVCGKTKPGTKNQGHSVDGTDFNVGYHKGKMHFVEWVGECKLCKGSGTELRSYPCPGNNDGVGCVFPINKVDPPVEAEDVTEPEDEDLPEEAAPPGDEIAPGETAPGEK